MKFAPNVLCVESKISFDYPLAFTITTIRREYVIFKSKSLKEEEMLNKIIRYARDPLYKNSFFIMLTSISGAGFGFAFWMLAKLYPRG